ncbi:MAG: methylmalonyl Co-A mutase-associated GTPase MeaB [Bacteroidia bacterium]
MPRARLSIQTYIDGVLSGDRVILSRAITLVESTHPDDQLLAQELIKAVLHKTGNSYRIGITGVPGVGKSTFIDAFGTMLTEKGKRVAVLAIDPSSKQGQGSILGDKTRMQRRSHNRSEYVRTSTTGGSLGGVAQKTRESLLLCEAAGYDTILVETVGVGQSETAVHAMVDAFLLLMLPNAGDDLQGIKKGVMEMADILVVNKSDGDYLPKARAAKALYSQALRLFPHRESGWLPAVSLCSALEETGLEDLWEALDDYQKLQKNGPWWLDKRAEQAVQWMEDEIQRQLGDRFLQSPQVAANLPQLREAVRNQQQSPIQAARTIWNIWEASLRK